MTNRGNFSGRIGFILAAAGSAVGLGNIWRFPYLAGENGGAIFLLVYLGCILLLCYPVMVGEISIGRAANSDAYGSYSKLGGKKWGYLGLFGIIAGIMILSFYNVVAGWAFGYFLHISFGDLLNEQDFGGFFGSFVNDILNVSSVHGLASSNLIFSLVFMMLTAVIVTRGIQKGIEASNRIMMPTLYIILIGIILYSLSLPNAFSGVRFYLIPDFSELKIQTVVDGLKQAFFSLSLGMGGLITYGSYLSKKENITSSAMVISAADTSVAFFAGLMVFPLVHFLAFKLHIDPTEIGTSGPPLIFVVLPQIFHEMGPVLGRIIGGSFFLLVCFAALTSTISLLEVPVAYLVDQKKYNRKHVVWVMALIIFICGIPSMMSQGMVAALNNLTFYKGQDFLTFISDMSDICLTIGGCLMSIFISRRWGIKNMDTELAQGNDRYMTSGVRKYLHVTINWIAPILLGSLSIVIILEKFFGIENLI
ncbi:MAG TPA: sodium-dependent transporter [Cyclobacteriaceae bacterium]|jgi:NSS family neurotransmitter:Na+ symporter|nr:sodium-dependent transporter [Cytophagales bacterium]HRE66961.1 sodium-dependent transporter [Cyclobacteriaceae bacterium]HRF33135.1 sodium-dependent transporter [Cyclobacteriaceae bacterium]